MNELMIILAKTMPEEMLIDQLEEAITNYKIAPSKETKEKLTSMVVIITTRFLTEDQSLNFALSQYKKTENTMKLFDIDGIDKKS